MNTKLSPVDYGSHPLFESSFEPWVCNEDLIAKFSGHYEKLKNGKLSQIHPILDALSQIKSSLVNQIDADLEIAFVEELFADVEKLLSDEFRFYQRRSEFSPRRFKKNVEMLRDGSYYITNISEKTLKKIEKTTKRALVGLRNNASNGLLRRSDLTIDSGVVPFRICRILNKEFKKTGVLESLKGVLPGNPKVVGVAFELSVAGSNWWNLDQDLSLQPKTLYAHVDRIVSAPKAIVYLTEVKRTNGPTTAYPNIYENISKTGLQDLVGRCLENVGRSTESPLNVAYGLSTRPFASELFRRHFMKLPPSIRFNSHFGWDVISGSVLEDSIVSAQVEVVGEPGTTLVFDGGRLLHRGGLIESGERVILQVVFGSRTTKEKVVWLLRGLVSLAVK